MECGQQNHSLLDQDTACKTVRQTTCYEGEKRKITGQEHQIWELKEKFYGE